MTEDQIKHMVNRFLGWRLPGNFNPDAGIRFITPIERVIGARKYPMPSGTNLFDATQADAMVRYMVEGMPFDAVQKHGEELGGIRSDIISVLDRYKYDSNDVGACADRILARSQPMKRLVEIAVDCGAKLSGLNTWNVSFDQAAWAKFSAKMQSVLDTLRIEQATTPPRPDRTS